MKMRSFGMNVGMGKLPWLAVLNPKFSVVATPGCCASVILVDPASWNIGPEYSCILLDLMRASGTTTAVMIINISTTIPAIAHGLIFVFTGILYSAMCTYMVHILILINIDQDLFIYQINISIDGIGTTDTRKHHNNFGVLHHVVFHYASGALDK